jgi:hypothetical protein
MLTGHKNMEFGRTTEELNGLMKHQYQLAK